MDAPNAPSGLLKASRDRWETFWSSPLARYVEDTDMARLVRWIEASDELTRVLDVLRKSRLVRGSMGQPVLNPLASYVQQLQAEVERAEHEFGMTPTSRLRLLAERGPDDGVDEEFERLVADLSSPMDDSATD